MSTMIILFAVGIIGGGAFEYFKIPGGAMVGAMVVVAAVKILMSMGSMGTPEWLKIVIYSSVGVLVGNMVTPEILKALHNTWYIILGSTAFLLVTSWLCAWVVATYGGLSPASAYLATTPGGFNAVASLASYSADDDTAIVLAYHMVRIYAIVLLFPLVLKCMHFPR